jgi:hypothetical protein
MAASGVAMLLACGGGTPDTVAKPLALKSAEPQASPLSRDDEMLSLSAARALPSALPMLTAADCVPSGVAGARDYQVGPGAGQLSTLEQVPWDRLAAGDTVRIHHRSTPYLGKFLIAASGTAAAPVRVCGVKSSTGQRPVIDGKNALTRSGLDYGDSASTEYVHQTRSVIVLKRLGSDPWEAYPRHIQIDGLEVRGAVPGNTFTDAQGTVRTYEEFGACIWIDRGHHITLADNVIHDCSQGVYSKSTDDGDFAVSQHIRLAGNHIHGNGIAGSDRLHNTYMASAGTIYEFNRYGPLRAGAMGNAIKDRSVGTVVRYNRIEGGARALDLVEAEDFPQFALTRPAYRATVVYGNQIIKSGDTGSTIHYGGDHFGSEPGGTWGEPYFRRGTLYFYNNTVRLTGGSGAARLFQLSTTLERAEVWNNVFIFDAGIKHRAMRANQDVNPKHWTGGGIVNLGKNWVSAGWADSDPWHKVTGQLLGRAQVLSGSSAPVDPSSLRPLPGGAAIDAGQTVFSPSVTAILAAFPVKYQLDGQFRPTARSVTGAGVDLGALER